MLVFMNTLSDYGTAVYYGVETFSAGILSYDLTWATRTRHPCWRNFLIMFVFILMIFEHISKTSKRYSFSAHDTSKFMQKRELGKFASKAAFYGTRSCFYLRFYFLLSGFCIGAYMR